MDLDKLHELIRIFEASELSEIEVEEEGRRVRLMKPAPNTVVQTALPMAPVARVDYPAHMTHEMGAPAAAPKPQAIDDGHATINSPMVGVFYVAPAPGEPPFVRPGDKIDKDQTVCIVEAMKLMNEVSAKFPAEIISVLVENGEPVEYNQPLFTVSPIE